MKISVLFATTAIGFLAACGGSNSNAALIDQIDEVDSINAFAESLPYQNERDWKTTGSARYEGYLGVAEFTDTSENADPSFLAFGDANVRVNFRTGATTGSASNFQEVDVSTIDFNADNQDTSAVRGAAIDGSFDVNASGTFLTGTLTHRDGEVATYRMGVDDVEYYGNDSEVLQVFGSGTSTAPGRAAVDSVFDFAGVDVTVDR